MSDTSNAVCEPAEAHYHRDDPRLMGETVAMGAHLYFGTPKVATYECQGQWFRYIAGGSPFKVELRAIYRDKEKMMFVLEQHSDGLTFHFAQDADHLGTSQIVLNSAKDQAKRMRHHI